MVSQIEKFCFKELLDIHWTISPSSRVQFNTDRTRSVTYIKLKNSNVFHTNILLKIFNDYKKKRLIAWRREFLLFINLNELRIRLFDTTHCHLFLDIRLQFNTERTFLKNCFPYISIQFSTCMNEALGIFNITKIQLFKNVD